MEPTQDEKPSDVQRNHTKAITVRLNPWWLVAVLSIGLVAAIVAWHPWQPAADAADRTVSVSGSATIEAEPDEFVFTPQYEYNNSDKAAGLAELTNQSDEIVAALKKLGVADKDIKSNASGYQDYYVYDSAARTHNYTLSITVTTHTKAMAQKVQDYLLTTTPVGAVSPQATFSTAKQKAIESEGREAATKEARSKAEQQAKNLGFKVGAVKSVEDGSNDLGGVMPMYRSDSSAVATTEQKSLTVQPGTNELTYTVDVVYYIR